MKASELHDLRENCAGSSSKSMVSWGQAFRRLPLKTGPAILAQTTPTQRVAVLTVSCKPQIYSNGAIRLSDDPFDQTESSVGFTRQAR